MVNFSPVICIIMIKWFRRRYKATVKPQHHEPAYAREDLTSTEHLPRSIYCPIRCAPMIDPVVASDGHSYDRDAIETWLKRKKTSPVTNETISETLLANHALRATIAELIPSR